MDCPVCERGPLSEFFLSPDVPVFCNVLHASREEALDAARGDIRLGFCAACGMIFNVAFEAERVTYAHGYENSLHGSPHFQSYAVGLAEGLVERHELRGARLLEIGGGRGEFLELLCRAGGSRGVVYDPSAPAESIQAEGDVRIVSRVFDGDVDEELDLICTRHVLEHVPDPVTFLAHIHAARRAGGATAVYVEVPNALWTLRDLGVWDLLYEHCSYFAPCSLRASLRRAELDDMHVDEVFGGQFLAAESGHRRATVGEEEERERAQLARLVDAFATRYRERLEHWREVCGAAERAGRRLALWGAGTKGVTFLHALGLPAAVRAVVDVNPRKHGRYLPGTEHRVLAPEELAARWPDQVVVMNPLYSAEIGAELATLGFTGELVAA